MPRYIPRFMPCKNATFCTTLNPARRPPAARPPPPPPPLPLPSTARSICSPHRLHLYFFTSENDVYLHRKYFKKCSLYSSLCCWCSSCCRWPRRKLILTTSAQDVVPAVAQDEAGGPSLVAKDVVHAVVQDEAGPFLVAKDVVPAAVAQDEAAPSPTAAQYVPVVPALLPLPKLGSPPAAAQDKDGPPVAAQDEDACPPAAAQDEVGPPPAAPKI